MKSNYGEGSIRQKPNGHWEGRVSIQGERKSFSGKTKKEVVDRMKRCKAEAALGLYVKDPRITFSEWLRVWLDRYCLSVKDTTKAKYASDIRLYIEPHLGKISLSKLSGADIQGCYTKLITKGLCPKTIRNIHGTIHKALAQAVKLRVILVNPADACDLPKVIRKEMNPIADDLLGRFLSKIRNSKFGSYYYVMIFTGLRRSELLGLTWDCIDFRKGTMRIYRQWSKHPTEPGYCFAPLKNSKERTIRPAESVMRMLKAVKKKQAGLRLQAGADWENPEGFVFVNEKGHFLNGNTVFREFKRIVRELGIEETRLHDLRHTFAMLSLENGTDVKTLSQTLGHATTAFTMDVYGHVSEKMQRDAAQRMEERIQGIK